MTRANGFETLADERRIVTMSTNKPSPTREEIDAMITSRIVQFHEALVERGQIAPSAPAFGITADCKADQAAAANPFQRRSD